GDLAERLLDTRSAAASAGGETLHDQVLAHEGLGDDQRVDVEVVVVLGVGDRRIERLADVLGDALVAELELVQRPLHLEAADRLGDQVQLAGGGAERPHLAHRFDASEPASFGLLAHDYFLLAFLSAAWPGKKRVGANSPSFMPTMSSETSTGTCFWPLWTPKVRPTNCGMMVERRDQVLITSLRPED